LCRMLQEGRGQEPYCRIRITHHRTKSLGRRFKAKVPQSIQILCLHLFGHVCCLLDVCARRVAGFAREGETGTAHVSCVVQVVLRGGLEACGARSGVERASEFFSVNHHFYVFLLFFSRRVLRVGYGERPRCGVAQEGIGVVVVGCFACGFRGQERARRRGASGKVSSTSFCSCSTFLCAVYFRRRSSQSPSVLCVGGRSRCGVVQGVVVSSS